MNWYYADGGTQVGPFADADFDNLIANGTVKPDTLVWREGMADWRPCSEVKPAAGQPLQLRTPPTQPGAPPSAGGMVCCECGNTFPPEEMIRHGSSFVCAACKPVFIQKLKEGVRLPGAMEYAGFWIRFAAVFVDGIILWVVNTSLSMVAGLGFAASIGASPEPFTALQLVLILVQFLIGISYETFFIGKYGATLGKMACKIRVVTADGDR